MPPPIARIPKVAIDFAPVKDNATGVPKLVRVSEQFAPVVKLEIISIATSQCLLDFIGQITTLYKMPHGAQAVVQVPGLSGILLFQQACGEQSRTIVAIQVGGTLPTGGLYHYLRQAPSTLLRAGPAGQ